MDLSDSTDVSSVAFIGLGVMGTPMARHLAAAGHSVTVYNRTPAKALAWVALTGIGRHRPRRGAEGAEFVILCVGNDDDVRDVVGDHGALAGDAARRGARRPHDRLGSRRPRARRGVRRSAASASSTRPCPADRPGAENGALTVMCGSDDEASSTRLAPVMRAYAKACWLMGEAGTGQLTKMVNQIRIAGIVQGLAEGINFAMRAGLDLRQVVDVVSKGAAGSWQMENRRDDGSGEFDFGFAVEWMRKDLGIVLEEAHRNGARLPVTALIDQFYAQVIDVAAPGGTPAACTCPYTCSQNP